MQLFYKDYFFHLVRMSPEAFEKDLRTIVSHLTEKINQIEILQYVLPSERLLLLCVIYIDFHVNIVRLVLTSEKAFTKEKLIKFFLSRILATYLIMSQFYLALWSVRLLNRKWMAKFQTLMYRLNFTSLYCNTIVRPTMHRECVQKQPPSGALIKTYSENMQQICRRTPMLKYDFNKT